MKRSKKLKQILVYQNGKEVLKNRRDVVKRLDIQGFIRIQPEEFKYVHKCGKYLAHFNLEHTSHKVGKKYAISKILRTGSFKNNIEKLPLLSLKDMRVAKCIDVENNLKYKDITLDYFAYSLPNIKSIKDLQSVIFKRYSRSMPSLSKKEIYNLGIGFTLLKLK